MLFVVPFHQLLNLFLEISVLLQIDGRELLDQSFAFREKLFLVLQQVLLSQSKVLLQPPEDAHVLDAQLGGLLLPKNNLLFRLLHPPLEYRQLAKPVLDDPALLAPAEELLLALEQLEPLLELVLVIEKPLDLLRVLLELLPLLFADFFVRLTLELLGSSVHGHLPLFLPLLGAEDI